MFACEHEGRGETHSLLVGRAGDASVFAAGKDEGEVRWEARGYKKRERGDDTHLTLSLKGDMCSALRRRKTNIK